MVAYLKGFLKQSFKRFPAFLRSKKEAPSERRLFEPKVRKGFFSEGKKDFLPKAKKGISPIIASVLLIAFSATIATIVGTWAMDYTQGQISGLKLCKDTVISSYDFKFDSEKKEGSLILQNDGAPIEGCRVYAFIDSDNKELIKELKNSIKKSEKKTINFVVESDNAKGVIVEVINCPGVRLMLPID